jgi:UDP-N-acetylmuramyl pentapeptide phosphotransferase/UDP-N-acetylglucosamine-1-phosphate transferase
MGGIFVIISVLILICFSVVVSGLSPWMEATFGWSISHTLWNRNETYIVIFTLLSVAGIGLVDDYLNIK